ncbi:MAG: PKD domain-containing protein [Bacteroidota bacterium]|nr:PKD domain-containing protein [Bacteroidota bacterium]
MHKLSPKFILFLLATISQLLVRAQVGFKKEYGTPSNEQGCFVTKMEGSKILIGGIVLTDNKRKVQLLKLDSCLNVEFNKEYQENDVEGIGGNGLGTNYFDHLQNNNLILCGNTGKFSGSNGCPFVMEVDKSGNTVWSKAYSNIKGGIYWNVIRRSASGCYYTSGGGYSDFGFSINKIDSAGNILWMKKISSNIGYALVPSSIIPLINDEFVAIAHLQLGYPHSIAIFRFDSSGNLIWKRYIVSTKPYEDLYPNSATLLNQKIIICGYVNDSGSNQGLMLVLDLNGNTNIVKTYKFNDSTVMFSTPLITSDNNISIIGISQPQPNKVVSAALIKIDTMGNFKWAKKYNDSNNAFFTCHLQTEDGGYYLLGNKLSYINNQDFYFIKVDSLGKSACDYEDINVVVTDRTFKIDTNIKLYDSVITDMVTYPMYMKVKDVAVRERTYCNTQEPFAGIGSALGQDTIIVCDTNIYHIVNFKSNPNSQYYWSTGDTDRRGITVTQTGTYKLRVVKGICESIDSVYVIIAPMDNIVSTRDTLICAGNQITLNAQLKNGTIANIYSYSWSTGDTTQYIKASAAGVYKVTIKNQYGCKLIDSFKVMFIDSLKITNKEDTIICVGQQIVLYINTKGGAMATIKYNWFDMQGNIISNNKNYNTGILNTTTSYIYSVSDKCLIYTDTVTIYVREPLQVQFTSPIDICRGDTAALFVEGSGGDSLAYNYNWDNGLKKGKSQHVFPTTSTLYKVTLHDNCTLKDDTATVMVNVNSPTAFFDAVPDRTTIFHPQIVFNNKTVNSNNSNWYFGDGDSSLNQKNFSQYHNYRDTGTYKVKLVASNNFGCLDSSINTIIIADTFTCYIPNAFYPQSKVGNHIFYPIINDAKIIDMSIYNRWGELVYKTPIGCEPINGKYQGGNDCAVWNGKFMNNSSDCEQGIYLYTITFTDFSNFKHDFMGYLYLIR